MSDDTRSAVRKIFQPFYLWVEKCALIGDRAGPLSTSVTPIARAGHGTVKFCPVLKASAQSKVRPHAIIISLKSVTCAIKLMGANYIGISTFSSFNEFGNNASVPDNECLAHVVFQIFHCCRAARRANGSNPIAGSAIFAKSL